MDFFKLTMNLLHVPYCVFVTVFEEEDIGFLNISHGVPPFPLYVKNIFKNNVNYKNVGEAVKK